MKIGIPSNERMFHQINALFQEAFIPLVRTERANVSKALYWKDLEAVYIRCREIPLCLGSGGIDCGITTTNMLVEYPTSVQSVLDFDFGFHKMVLAAPAGTKLEDFNNAVVATSYPHIAQKFFDEHHIKNVRILNISGAVEAYPQLGLAKGIVDVCETGKSLKENQLVIIEEIMEAHPVLVARTDLDEQSKKSIEFIKESLLARIHAQTARKFICTVQPENLPLLMERYYAYNENNTTFKFKKKFNNQYEFFCRLPKVSCLLKQLYEQVPQIGIEIYEPTVLFYEKKED